MNQYKRNSIKKAYENYGSKRDQDRTQKWKDHERNRFSRILLSENKKKILDLGCGTGYDTEKFQTIGMTAIGIDFAHSMLQKCRKRCVSCIAMDFEFPSFKSVYFDAIWSLNSLIHLPALKFLPILNELMTLLKPDGLFYLGLYGGIESEGIWEGDIYHPKRYFTLHTHDNLYYILADHFIVIDSKILKNVSNHIDFHAFIIRKYSHVNL